MNIVRRVRLLISRKLNAKALGVSFGRSANWKLPPVVSFKGIRYEISGESSIGTADAFRDILIDDEYKLRSLTGYQIGTIIDVGGHSGFFSFYSKLLFPSAVVHCYEPNNDLVEFIKGQQKQVGFNFFPEAVGKENGTVRLERQTHSINNTTKFDAEGDIILTSIEKCLVRIGGKCDILKLDCEGAEWQIFEDTESFKNVNIVTMEFHLVDNKTVDDLIKTMNRLNFEIKDLRITGPTWGMLLAFNRSFLETSISS